MIGTRFQDKYEVMKRIGKGGFASVYSGFDTKLERAVAIKFLEESAGSGGRLIAPHLQFGGR